MKKLLFVVAILSIVGTTGCKYFKKDKPKVDVIALEKAKKDSIAKVKAFEAEKIRKAEEQARLDSIQKVQEYEAKYKFHVIIGSFKVPSNATNWEQEVHNMGFTKTKILHANNGFDLVSVGQFETYSKAFNEIDRINSDRVENPIELWIYEK
ncbi:MAG TPA: SPOR domain-containing protein [Tenuifilaceae bacterium]|nr:SPOR domain-containing protein [Tenuifilaceae bacterium]